MQKLMTEILGAMLGHKFAGSVGVNSDLGKAAFAAAGGAAGRMAHPHLEELIRKYTETGQQEEISNQINLNAIVQRQIGFIAGRTLVMLISDRVFDSLEKAWGKNEPEVYQEVISDLKAYFHLINDEFDRKFKSNLKNSFDGFDQFLPKSQLDQILVDAEQAYKSQASYYLDAVVYDLEDRGKIFS